MHYRRAERVLSRPYPMASWQETHLDPLLFMPFQQETFVVTTPATSSLGIWAPGIHSILLLSRTAMETCPSSTVSTM